MPAPLTEGLSLLAKVREENKGVVDHLDDASLADLVYQQTGDERLKPIASSSALARGVAKTGMFFGEAGKTVEGAIANEKSSFPVQVAGRVAGNLVSGIPELAAGAVAAGTRGIPRALAALGGAGFSYGRTKADTGDEKAAIGSGVGFVAGLVGGVKGAQLGEKLVGPAAGKAAKFVGGAVGGAVGQAPGDYVAAVTAPGETMDLQKFREDPLNVSAYLAGQPATGAVLHVAQKAASAGKALAETNKAKTPDLADFITSSDEDWLVSFNKKPIAERTELEVARAGDIGKRMARQDEAIVKNALSNVNQMTATDVNSIPEAPVTLKAQIHLLNINKKPVVQVPKGSELPVPFPVEMQVHKDHYSEVDGQRYFYNDKLTTPDQIDNAIRTKTLGHLLGYGVGDAPANPNGKMATLRSPKGVEMASVILSDDTQPQVLAALGKMARGGDKIAIEPVVDTLKWRLDNRGLKNVFSLSKEHFGAAQDEIGFTNHVVDMFNRSLTPLGGKGAKFQLDAEGNISGKGLLKAIKAWAPGELFAHYQDAGIETLLGTDKVSGGEFTKWLRENTPEVEVKKLEPGSHMNMRVAETRHIFETAGFYIDSPVDGVTAETPLIIRNAHGAEMLLPDVEAGPLREAMAYVYQNAQLFGGGREYFGEGSSDAATGRYGVEPKSLENMPGAVDILVRVPIRKNMSYQDFLKSFGREDSPNARAIFEKTAGDIRNLTNEKPLFQGPHFGDSDVNVLASIRGYMETLPTGEKAFHVFEVQSDWGQKVSREVEQQAALKAQPSIKLAEEIIKGRLDEKDGMTYEEASNWLNNANLSGRVRRTADHPLLAHYETLALKVAIQHARSEGATKIAISDAETAMMTEGHDRRYGLEERDPNDPTKALPFKPAQEPGMRAAYDERLPAIMKKLTGDKGGKADFGPSKYANGGSPSPVFKDAFGKPKTQITARLYDITNPNPSIRRLFSLYDVDAQANFEAGLRLEREKIDRGLRDAEELTPRALLERAVKHDAQVSTDALLKFVDNIKGTRGILREQAFDAEHIAAMTDLTSGDVTVNKAARLTLQEAFGTLSHEFTHVAIEDLYRTDMPAYRALVEDVNAMGAEQRLAILQGLKDELKLGSRFDPEYLAGKLFDPAEAGYNERIAHEFAGGLMEAVAHSHYASETMPAWFRYVPQPLVKMLTSAVKAFRQYFRADYPSVTAMLDSKQGAYMERIVSSIEKNVLKVRDDNVRALTRLQKSAAFDEGSFVDNLAKSNNVYGEAIGNLRGGDGQLASFAGDLFRSVRDAAEKKFENHIFTGLFRAKTRPETAGHFMALHNMRPNIVSDNHGYFAFLGQEETGSLSRQQALERFATLQDKYILAPTAQAQKFRDAFGTIQERNQKIIQKLDGRQTEADLVPFEKLSSEFGLPKEAAEFGRRLSKVNELVAAESRRKNEVVDTINLTKLFYGANKAQDLEGVRAKVQRINRVTKDAGMRRFERNSYERQLEEVKRIPGADQAEIMQLEATVQQLKTEEANFKTLVEQNIRMEFAGSVPMKDGKDPFVAQAAEVMTRLSAMRRKEEVITGNLGWASMTRRGRFRLRVYEDSVLGEEFAKVAEYRGFQTEAQMKEYIAKNQLKESNIETMDMNDVKERVKAFTPDRLTRIRDMARKELDGVLEQVQANAAEYSPEQTLLLNDIVHQIQTTFQPLEAQIKDVISVKGDKFGQRRFNVEGFDKNDFLPNTFEYIDYQTVKGNKAVARAESELQTFRRELDDQPDLRARMDAEREYVLSNQTEHNLAKKLVFYFYLGGSFRHIVQNSIQIPMNGISQMVADGHGFDAYKHFGKAAKLAAEYAVKGTTGDKAIDVLLKQAEKDGVSFSTAIESPIHESVDLQNKLDSIHAASTGGIGFGQKVNYVGTKTLKGFEKFMMASSAAAEAANRKTTFIAKVLAERSKGSTDIRDQYVKATEFTNFVNFVGDKPNRPGYLIDQSGRSLHGPLVLWSALQSFTMNHLSQLYSFYHKGFKQGSVADKKAFAVGVAHLLAFSGSMGFIGAATAEQLFQQLNDGKSLKTLLREGVITGMTSLVDTDEEKEKMAHVGDRVADGILHGLPGLVGIGAGDSVGLGSPFFRYQAGQPLTVEQFGGAAVGMAGRVGQAVGQVADDPFDPASWQRGGRTAAPAFLAHALRIYDVLNSGGSLDKNRQPVGEPEDTLGSASSVLGFPSMQSTKEREVKAQTYLSEKRASERYQQAVLRTASALAEHEKTGDEEQLLRANGYFADYISSVNGLQDRDAFVAAVTAQLGEFRSAATRPATLKNLEARQRLEAAYPSVKAQQPSAVSSALDELDVAQSLGQEDVLARKLAGLPSSLRQKVLTDLLREAGVPQAEVQSFVSPRGQVRLGSP